MSLILSLILSLTLSLTLSLILSLTLSLILSLTLSLTLSQKGECDSPLHLILPQAQAQRGPSMQSPGREPWELVPNIRKRPATP